jgi:DNA-directed RNA polymerase specialized sigma24 family protein
LASRIDQLADSTVSAPLRREGLDEMVELLNQWHGQRRSEAFMSFLAPVVETLGSYVQRELMVRESDEILSREQVTARDVLDDVLVHAWERYQRRAADLPLDLWLVQLADEALNRLSGQVAQQSMDVEMESPTPEWREFDTDHWIEQDSYPETIELSDLLPGESGVADWDDLEMETKQAHLAAMLGQLPRERRQAFVLQLAHGYNTAEIADFQNRPGHAVEADVAEAVAAIRRFFSAEQGLDVQERFAKLEMRQRKRRRR